MFSLVLDFDSVLNQFYKAINESKMEFEEGEQMMMMMMMMVVVVVVVVVVMLMMMMMMMIVNIEFGNTFYVAILQIVSLRTSQKCC